jgi:hypothetical protein
MEKIIVGLTVLIFGINDSIAQNADFRDFTWGNSIEKIRNDEKAHFYSALKRNELVYDDKLGSSNFKVLYIFNDNNKLISGNYIFLKNYSNIELYYQDYKVFFKLLTEKYGKPTNEKETWSSVDPTFDKTNKIQAIADKNLNLYAIWNTERTVIKITLISIGTDMPSMQIHYTTASLDHLENPIDLKDALSKL